MKKIKYIEQMEHSECALACIAMIINYYGYSINLSTLRDKFGVPIGGYNILQIIQILKNYNISSKAFKINNIDEIDNSYLPLIAYWNDNHYIIVEKFKKKKVLITDPALGRILISIDEFKQHFSNKVILCAPNESFEKHKDKNKINFFSSIVLKKKKNIAILLFLSLLLQAFSILVPIMDQYLIDYLNINIDIPFLNKLGICIFAFTISYYLLNLIRSFIIIKFQIYFDKNLMDKLLKHILKLPYSFFTNRSTGELLFRANSNSYVCQILTDKFISIFIDLLLAFIYLFMMFKYSLALSILVIIIAIVLSLLSFFNSNKFNSITNDEMIEQVKVQKSLTEMIEGILTIKSIGSESIFFNKWSKLFDRQLQFTYKKGILNAIFTNISGTLIFIIPMIIIWYGSYFIKSNDLTIGTIVAFNTISTSFLKPILSLSDSYSNILILKTILNKLYDIIDSKPEKIITDNSLKISKGNITLNHVFYKYNVFNPYVINDVSFSINAGDKVAIVGKSGCGKSTLLKLILGLYSPEKGSISVDDIDISSINIKDFRSQIGVVLQEPQLFNDTVKNNILIGKENIPDSLLYKVAELSGINDFLVNTPLGLDTIVSEKGINFSGGQRQRISLARALINNPKILLMDEPTSSLDNESESSFMSTILKLSSTCIVVSHRLSTIINFNKIIVIDNGKIVEVGSHDELMSKKGYYQKLYSSKMNLDFQSSYN